MLRSIVEVEVKTDAMRLLRFDVAVRSNESPLIISIRHCLSKSNKGVLDSRI